MSKTLITGVVTVLFANSIADLNANDISGDAPAAFLLYHYGCVTGLGPGNVLRMIKPSLLIQN